MGSFHADCEVVNSRDSKRTAKVRKLLVDAGSEFTWLPAEVLKPVGVTVVKKDVAFQIANGQTIARLMGYAILQANAFETIDEVVFGEPGDLCLLGSRTLEGFGATVDRRKKRLVAAGPYPAAGAQARSLDGL